MEDKRTIGGGEVKTRSRCLKQGLGFLCECFKGGSILGAINMLVSDHSPVLIRGGTELPCCFNVRLVEAREHKVGIVSFELGVKILQAISLVNKGVEANAILTVLVANQH